MDKNQLESLIAILLERIRHANEMSISELCKEAQISTKTYMKIKKSIRTSDQDLQAFSCTLQTSPS